MLEPNRDRIERALLLFGEGLIGQPQSLVTVFECLGAEMLVRSSVGLRVATASPDQAALRELAGLFSYAGLRLTDIFERRHLIDFIRSKFVSGPEEDAAAWHGFGALCVKDFHVDLASFMDSVAPVVLQACGAFDAAGKLRLPGFADIQGSLGSAKSPGFRARLPTEVLSSIDTTDTWWPDVKLIRDTLAHREHVKIAFGAPQEGVLFQVYAPARSPIVVHPAFLWPTAHHVADFRRYSAYVLVEVFLFIDVLGRAIAGHLGLSAEGLNPSYRAGDFSDLINPLREMLVGGTLH